MKKLLFLLSIVFMASSAAAQRVGELNEPWLYESNDIWYVLDDASMEAGVTQHYHRGYNNELLGDGGAYYSGDVVIPPYVNGYKVTAILPFAFDRAEGLTSISLPNTVKYIGEFAFQSCSFQSFTIPASVDSLANYSLWLIKAKKLIFEDSDNEIFVGMSQVNMFSNSEEVEELYLGRNVRSIGGLFQNNAVKRVTIGNKVTKVSNNCFNRCTSLEKLTLGTGITTIEDNAFANCTMLKDIPLPQSLTYIGKNAFHGCTALTSIKFPSNLKTIDEWAFNTTSLEEITIPPSVETIGVYAFSLKTLKKVTLQDGPRVLTVGRNDSWGSIFSGSIQSIEEAYIGRKLKPDANSSDGFFASNPTLRRVTFGPYINEVSDKYFSNCRSLVSVNLHANISRIGQEAFSGCTALQSISFPASLTKIDNSAFYGCSALESLNFNMGLKEIGDYAFYSCGGLRTMSLQPYLTNIGENAFYGDSKLEAIYCRAVTPPVCANSRTFEYLDTRKCKLYVPEQSLAAYQSADVWKNFFIVGSIPTGIQTPVSSADVPQQPYSIDGQQLGSVKKGLNIVRRPDGTAVKVIVR